MGHGVVGMAHMAKKVMPGFTKVELSRQNPDQTKASSSQAAVKLP
jgi:hypothetical protein